MSPAPQRARRSCLGRTGGVQLFRFSRGRVPSAAWREIRRSGVSPVLKQTGAQPACSAARIAFLSSTLEAGQSYSQFQGSLRQAPSA